MLKEVALETWGSFHSNNRKPHDFDSFWLKGKEEVEALGLDYRLVEHELYSTVAEAFDLYFIGVNNACVHVQIVRPKNITKKMPVIFQFHGYHTNAGDWGDKIANAAEGILTVALNVRGQGGPSQDTTVSKGGTLKGHIIRGVEDGPEQLLFRQAYLDIYQLTRIVTNMDQIDINNMYAYGASQGGALALICGYFEPRIKKIFTLYPFLSIFREAYRLDVENSAYEELAYWFRFRDPQHKNEQVFFETLDYIDIQYFVPSIKSDVIWGIGLEDRICHPKIQMGVYNAIKSTKEMLFYPEYAHEYIPEFSDIMRKQMFLDLNTK